MNIHPPFVKFNFDLEAYRTQLPPASKDLQLLVTIPARNEAENIWKTLHALTNQYSANNRLPKENYEVIVLCNHCTDATREICELFRETHPGFPLSILETTEPSINSVGSARRLLMDLASERLTGEGFIVMTDADTVADASWLDAFLNMYGQPVDLVCGVIVPDLKGLNKKAEIQLTNTRHYLELVSRLESELYPRACDPWPRHSHNSGPNMAIRNWVYKKIGGIPPLDCLEDIALYQRVLENSFRVKHSYAPVVTTSCRSASRVPGGFGSQIKNWSISRTEMVEGLLKLQERFIAFAEIREYYRQPSSKLLQSLSNRLYLQKAFIYAKMQQHPTESSFCIFLEGFLKQHPNWNKAYPNKPLEDAIEELTNHFAAFSQTINSYSSCR